MILKKTIATVLVAGVVVPLMAADIVAFPGAQGWGRYAKGARTTSSPTVYHVTNLNDSGTGSLRDAVSASNRIVVFDVSGVINISSRISFASNLYVAGQTAPGEGITVYGDGVSFSNASNIICRYLRVRMGHNGSSGKDCAGISRGTNMIFDHCSFSWGLDETFSINPDGNGDLHSITLQNCIFGQGLMTHSAGGLMQADSITLYRNLYIDNSTRNNKIKGINQYANNVVYNWSNGCYIMGGDSEGTSYVNIESNLFINGPSGGGNCFGGANANFHAYGNDNWQDSNKDGVFDPSIVTNYSAATVESEPYDYPDLELYAGNELIEKNIPTVGASLPYRDQSDCYMIDELMSYGTSGALISNEENLAIGAPSTWTWWSGEQVSDTDGDGMPDVWEEANGTDPKVDDATVKASNGYLNIENYINSITVEDRQLFLRQPITLGYTSTTSTLTLTWRDYTYGEDGFKVEYKLSTDSDYKEAGTAEANATSYTISGLEDGTAYDVRVYAYYNNEGSTITSAYATGTYKTRPIEVGIIDIDSYEPTVTNSTDVADGAALLLTTNDVLDYTLTSAINPASVVATGTGTITVSGAAIGGEGTSVNKGDAGTLALNYAENTYTGATVLHNGVLEFSSIANGGVASALGASQEFAQNWVMDGGTYCYTGTSNATTNRSAKLTNPTTLAISSGKTLTMNGVIEGSGDDQNLIIDGNGQVTVGTTSFFGYTGTTTLKGGTLYLSTVDIAKNGIGSSSKLVMAGGTLKTKGETSSYETYAFPIEVVENTTSVFAPNRLCYMNNTLTGAGTLEIQVPYLREYFSLNTSNFTGKLVVNGLNSSDGSLFLAKSSFSLPTTQVYLKGAGKTYMAAWETNASNTIGGLSGDAGTYLVGSSKNTKNFTCSWTVGGSNSDETFNGIINSLPAGLNSAYSGTVNITKVGTGLWRLNGKNTYSGTTNVSAGTLIVNGSHTGGAAYTVAADATLKGMGSIASAVTVKENGILAAGDTLVASHTLTLSNAVTLQSGAILEVPVSYYGAAVKSNYFTCSNITLNEGAILKLDLTEVESAMPENSCITVFDVTSSVTGEFASVMPATPGEGLKWDLSRLYTNGKIYVRNEDFDTESVTYKEASWFDESALDTDGFYWFNADNETTSNQMIAEGSITLNAKATMAYTYTHTSSPRTGALKLSKTGSVVLKASSRFMSAKLSLFRAGTALMAASLYASNDGETWVKLDTIKSEGSVEAILDFTSALTGNEYTYLKLVNSSTTPLYFHGAAITFEKMYTGLESVSTDDETAVSSVYDLQGRRSSTNAKGITIQQGNVRMQY